MIRVPRYGLPTFVGSHKGPSVRPSVCPPVCLSVRLSVRPSVCPPVRPSVRPSGLSHQPRRPHGGLTEMQKPLELVRPSIRPSVRPFGSPINCFGIGLGSNFEAWSVVSEPLYFSCVWRDPSSPLRSAVQILSCFWPSLINMTTLDFWLNLQCMGLISLLIYISAYTTYIHTYEYM